MTDADRPGSPNLGDDIAAGTAFPYGDETYCRRISVRPGDGGVDAEMEDYVHHFAVRIDHAGGRVTAASAEGVRHPWDACPGGANGIRRLVGELLVDAGDRHGWSADRVAQCVHVVDLAVLACRHANDDVDLSYEIRVTNTGHARRTATLWHDGEEVWVWELNGNRVIGPERFDGLDLRGARFFSWVRDHLSDPADRERAEVLRRAVHISTSRGMDLDRYAVAADGGTMNDSCFVFRSEVAVHAKRIVGTTRRTERGETTQLER